MASGLVRNGSDVEAPQAHKDSLGAIVVGDAIRPVYICDIRLDQDQVRLVVSAQRLHVLIYNDRFIIRMEVSGQSGQPQWREQGVLNRSPVGAGGLRQRGEDELHAQGTVAARPHWAPPCGFPKCCWQCVVVRMLESPGAKLATNFVTQSALNGNVN